MQSSHAAHIAMQSSPPPTSQLTDVSTDIRSTVRYRRASSSLAQSQMSSSHIVSHRPRDLAPLCHATVLTTRVGLPASS